MYTEVFLSYARKDVGLATTIVEKLEEDGIIVWWDEKLTPASEHTRVSIKEAIRSAQCFLVLWTENSIERGWVCSEVAAAINDEVRMAQICFDGVEPPQPYEQRSFERMETPGGMLKSEDLDRVVLLVKSLIGIQGPNEHLIRASGGWALGDPAFETPVPGLDFTVSFRPCGDSGVFLLMRFDTTDGWVKGSIPSAKERHRPYSSCPDFSYEAKSGDEYLKVANDVYFIMDPLRPYGIQIGGLRSRRPSAAPGEISGDVPVSQLRELPIELNWLSMTLAEILTSAESLEYLWEKISSEEYWDEEARNRVKKVISRNPEAPLSMQESSCLFCDEEFRKKRELRSGSGAYIIGNDYPFGPSFHYLVIAEGPVHSWEDLAYRKIKEINRTMHEFLEIPGNRRGAAGVSFGFNSTIRHLVLGKNTQSSAGASIPHVHKQAWGMAQKAANLAERLVEICQAYWNHGVDYQMSYISALREARYVIWEDENIVLYVPYGQCSKYEMQAMTIRPRSSLIEMTLAEVDSLSKAEYIVLRIFKALGINSFNQVVLSKLDDDTRGPTFRLVETFITREVDLAVSELSMLFVVDQHPWESRKIIKNVWDSLSADVLGEIDQAG